MKHNYLLGGFAALAGIASAAFAQGTPVPPGVGDLSISEVMFNPLCVADNDGEWFEVTNISGKLLDLNNLYFQDGFVPGASGDKYFKVLPSVATLPPLFPGHRFVFARSNNPTLNNGLPQVDYWYASTLDTTPADRSQVGHTAMNMGNSDPDGMHISIGNAAFFGGTVIASTTYIPTLGPIFPSDGISYEAINLYIPMVAPSVTQNSTNMLPASFSAGFGSCLPQELGTPGQANSVENTIWSPYETYNDSLNQNTGSLITHSIASIATGNVLFELAGGSPLDVYTLGIAEGAAEFPLSLLSFQWTGAILLDLNTAFFMFDPNDLGYFFDMNGNAQLNVFVPNNPIIVGNNYFMQWLAYDTVNGFFRLSNGLQLVVGP